MIMIRLQPFSAVNMLEFIPLIMFAVVCLVLLLGYPVAFTLAGTALMFAFGGMLFGIFDTALLGA